MMLPSVREADIKGKRVFLRADLDVPLIGGVINDDTRLKADLPTIEYLLDQKATVIVAGHLGRPEANKHESGITNQELSLRPVADWFTKNLMIRDSKFIIQDTKIGDFPGWKLSDNLYVLENLRFYEGEESDDPEFARKLAGLADIYVNDAFTVVHRNHASVVGIAKLLPHYAGFHLQKEVEVLGKVLENPKRPLIVIIGGAKIETKLPLISKMVRLADYVLVGGKLPLEVRSETHSTSSGQALEARSQEDERLIIAELTADGTDITGETVVRFKDVIAKAAMVVWNGPLGMINTKYAFRLETRSKRAIRNTKHDTEKGTRDVAEAIINSSAYKIVGGGDTIDYLKRLRVLEKFDFVSMGGGAMLAFLSGENLPGLEALQL